MERIRLPGPPVSYLPGAAPFSSPQRTGGQGGVTVYNSAPGLSEQMGFAEPVTPVFEPQRLARIIPGIVRFNDALGLPSRKFQAEQDNPRNFLQMKNIGTGIVYIAFGTQATADTFLALAAGQSVFYDASVPQDDLYCSATDALAVLSYGFSTVKA